MSLAAVVVCISNAWGEGPDEKKPVIAAVPEIQKQIQACALSIYQDNGKKGTDSNRFYSKLNQLRTMVGKDRVLLARQLIYYVQHADGMKDGMRAYGVLFALDKHIPPGEWLVAVVPYIDTDDPKLKRAVKKLLGRVEDGQPSREPDFSHYEGYIAVRMRAGLDIPEGLTNHIFHTSPGQAFRVCMRLFVQDYDRLRALAWAEHEIADHLWKQKRRYIRPDDVPVETLALLADLAARKEWWIQAYVNEIVEQGQPLEKKLQAYQERLTDKEMQKEHPKSK